MATTDTQDEVQSLVVRLPAEMHAELKARSQEDDLTMSQVVRRAVKEYLNSQRSLVAR